SFSAGPLGTTGSGANLIFKAGGTAAVSLLPANLVVNTDLNLSGVGNGSGGNIFMSTTGGNITVNGQLIADGAGKGGGTISIQSTALTESTVIPKIELKGLVSANGGSTDGAGGTIKIDGASASLVLASGVVAATGAKGGLIDVNVKSISVSGHGSL